MKTKTKILMPLLALSLMLALGGTAAFAAHHQGHCSSHRSLYIPVCWEEMNCVNYADENNDGVCDNRTSTCPVPGGNYTDEDNDGICDNRDGVSPNGRSRGNGRQDGGHHGGRHH